MTFLLAFPEVWRLEPTTFWFWGLHSTTHTRNPIFRNKLGKCPSATLIYANAVCLARGKSSWELSCCLQASSEKAIRDANAIYVARLKQLEQVEWQVFLLRLLPNWLSENTTNCTPKELFGPKLHPNFVGHFSDKLLKGLSTNAIILMKKWIKKILSVKNWY